MANARAKYEVTAEDKTKNAVRGIRKNFGDLESRVGTLKTSLIGLAGAGGFGLLIKSALDSADQIGKLSERLGASTEALSQYRFVAEKSGVTFQTLTTGWQRMTRRIAEAAQGTGEARHALSELGLSAKRLNQLRPERQFELLADALGKVDNQADKVRLAMKLFDSEGVSLLQTMKGGALAIRGVREEAHEFGLTLSSDNVRAAEDAKDAITELEGAVQGLTQTLVLDMSPGLSKIIRQLSVGIPQAIEFAQPAFEGIGNDIKNLWEFLNPSGVGLGTTLEEALRKQIELQEHLSVAQHGGTGKLINMLRQELDTQNLIVDALRRKQEMLKNQSGLGAIEVAGGNGEDSGEGAGGTPIDKRLRDRLTKRLETLQLSLMTEEERLLESYQNRQVIVNDAFEHELVNAQTHNELLLSLEAQYEQQRTNLVKKSYTERQKFAALSSKAQTKHVVGEMINLTQGVTTQNRKLFQINKIAGIANALINTYEGVSLAIAKYPPPLSGIMAGIQLASGLAQVNAIRSQSFSSGGGGGAPSLAATGGTPSNPVPQQDPNELIQQPEESGSQITIQIQGNVYANDDFRAALVETLEQAQANDEIRILNAN